MSRPCILCLIPKEPEAFAKCGKRRRLICLACQLAANPTTRPCIICLIPKEPEAFAKCGNHRRRLCKACYSAKVNAQSKALVALYPAPNARGFEGLPITKKRKVLLMISQGSSLKAVASFLGMTANTLYAWRKSGAIPGKPPRAPAAGILGLPTAY